MTVVLSSPTLHDKGLNMKDYTHVKDYNIKPYIYKNSDKLHFNYGKLFEHLMLAVGLAFIIFVGARFGVFEKTVVTQDSMKEDIANIQKDLSSVQLCISDIKIENAKRETMVISLKDDISEIKKLQIEIYKLNKVDRAKEYNKIMNK